MSQNSFIPSSDPAYNTWLANFAAKCALYEAEIGLTAEQLGTIQLQSSAFSESYDTVEAMKLELKGEIAGKDEIRRESSAEARALAKQIKGTPGVTPQILGALGIVSSSTSGPVVPVTDLTVKGCSDGVNMLKWKRNGNAQGTMFLIESRLEGSSSWNLVSAVSKTSYNDIDQIPGQTQYYRIKSVRAGVTSSPCDPAVVYSNGFDNTLTLAA